MPKLLLALCTLLLAPVAALADPPQKPPSGGPLEGAAMTLLSKPPQKPVVLNCIQLGTCKKVATEIKKQGR